MPQVLFYLFSLLMLAGAVGVVVNKNAVNGAMCFLLSLVGVAGLFVQLDAYLLAFVLLLVYAGAVVALFLFIIMLLNTEGRQKNGFKKFSVFAGLVALGLLLAGLGTFVSRGQLEAPNPNVASGVGAALKPYAYQLFTTYLLPVQVMGFMLLIAMLGVIVLSRKIDAGEDAS
ncbi:MAG: NADH-ubiquinone/plastoquinone oxidoreductase chain 6 [Verrucomicrobia bacterium]|nr:NADH-ubiquinone/plastoquinone oxidoreductase chain 6 [Verrucomicrobiota bacterium]